MSIIRTGSRLLRLSFACLATFFLCTAFAAPEDDYQKGAKSYAEGDVVTAMPHLKTAADAGHAVAQALYALILDRADSDDEAVQYYRKSAEQGNADGQYGYGTMLSSGEGIARDVELGRQWLTRAAEQGHKLAINELALAYMRGQLGVSEEARNSQDALRWIQLAAENKFVPAMEAMAEAYRNGSYGLGPDAKMAEDWMARARQAKGIVSKRKGARK